MKQHVKKTLSILLSVIMIVGTLCATALAAPADISDHTYDAYQIFEGSLGADGKIGQITWGRGVQGNDLLADLKDKMDAFDNCATAADAAKVFGTLGEDDLKAAEKIIYNHLASSPTFSNVTDNDNLMVNGKAGYFLLVDKTSTQNGTNTVKNLLILKVTDPNGITIRSKVDVPSVEKKVMDKDDTTPVTEKWQDSADYDIGDDVPFKLTANLATISDYETYKIIFNDTLSAGLTYNDDAKVYVDGNYKGTITGATSSGSNGQTNLKFTIDDVKSAPYGATDNSVVTIEYTAKLKDNAVCGSAGNPNTVYLQYSNNPFQSGEGNTNIGQTPEDKVTVFTFIFTIEKTDDQGNALNGASFTLSKNNNGTYEPISTIDGTRLHTFTWTGLDAGTYKLEETTVPAGYNKADDVIFTISATHDADKADPQLLTLSCDPDTMSVNFADGIISGTIKNMPGVELPETGGTGTTIFYVVGSLMLLGAVVVLVAKRRMVD